VLVIGEEFCQWEDSKCRTDLLGIDRDANLIVIELKRTEDGGHMELQAVRYAAMVSAMTFEKAVEVYAGQLASLGSDTDPRASILGFLGWEDPDEARFAQDVRIVLASAVRLKPYRDHRRVLLDVQQVIPLAEASDYMVRIREKEARERTARK
jgi:hypothetical protein